MAQITATIKLQGADKLFRQLRSLDRKVARKAMSRAMRAGAKIINAEAKARAPVRSGLLKKSIKTRMAKKRKRGEIKFNVGTSKGSYQGKTFYGAFVEFGWKVGSEKLGDDRKQVEPKPFLRPAFDAKKHEAAQTITSVLKSEIAAALSGG